RTWASQIFETTAVNVKYAHTGSDEVYIYGKAPGPSGQEQESLTKHTLGPNGIQSEKVAEAPQIWAGELGPIYSAISGVKGEEFVLGGNQTTEPGVTHTDSPQSLADALMNLQRKGQMPAVLHVNATRPPFLAGGWQNVGAEGSHV